MQKILFGSVWENIQKGQAFVSGGITNTPTITFYDLDEKGNVVVVAQSAGGDGFIKTAQAIALTANVADIAISTAEQTIQTTRVGANFAYAISGSNKLVNVVSNTIKYALAPPDMHKSLQWLVPICNRHLLALDL